jgi:transposase
MKVVKDLRTGASCCPYCCLEVGERFTRPMLHEEIMGVSSDHTACCHSGMNKGFRSGVHSSSTSGMYNGVRCSRYSRHIPREGSNISSPSEGVSEGVSTDIVHGLEGVPYIGC